MYHVISGPRSGELRSTGGENKSTPVLTKYSKENTPDYNTSYPYHSIQTSSHLRDYRQVSTNALILDIVTIQMITFEPPLPLTATRSLVHLNRVTNETFILGGVSQPDPWADARSLRGFLVDSTNNHHLYLLHHRILFFVNLKESPDNFTRYHNFSENLSVTQSYLNPSFLHQHNEYLYTCIPNGLIQKYRVYRMLKITKEHVLSDGPEVTELDIELPPMKSGLRFFIVLDGLSFLVSSGVQLYSQREKMLSSICNGGIPYSEGTTDTCSLWDQSALAIYNDNVYIATQHLIVQLVWKGKLTSI